MGPTIQADGPGRIYFERRFFNRAPTLRADAVRAGHQPIERIVDPPQSGLKQLFALKRLDRRLRMFEQSLANVFTLSMQTIPNEPAFSSDGDCRQLNCAILSHDVP